jgi:hypothetical protein
VLYNIVSLNGPAQMPQPNNHAAKKLPAKYRDNYPGRLR